MSERKDTRVDVQLSPELYAQIEEIARRQKAKVHHISKKPIIKDAVIDLLKIGLAHYGENVPDTVIRQLPDTDEIDNRIQAAIAPLITRVERLEAKPTGITPATATTTPPDTDEPEQMDNPQKSFDDGLQGKDLAARLRCDAGGLSKASKKENFAEWSAEKDPDGLRWRRDDDGRYRPIKGEVAAIKKPQATAA